MGIGQRNPNGADLLTGIEGASSHPAAHRAAGG
jgi:hypothetical protein